MTGMPRGGLPKSLEVLQNGGMGATERVEQDRLDASSGTLGDLLYADKSRTPVSEKDWIGLVQAIAAGDQLALHGLYERAHRVVFTLIMRITGSRETAEELTVDVFYDVWRRASRYDAGNGTVLGWIMNQARSRAIDRLRFEQRKKRMDPHASDPVLALEPGVPAIETTDCHDALAFKEQSRALRSALTRLTPGEREAVEAAFFSELTHTAVPARVIEPAG